MPANLKTNPPRRPGHSLAGVTLLLFFFLPLHADEIFLKEGKSIQGKIIHEDKQEITILLGSNMMLRIKQDKISKVTRPPAAAKTNRLIVRTEITPPRVAGSTNSVVAEAPKSSASVAATVVSKSTPAQKSPIKAEPYQVKVGVDAASFKREMVQLERTVMTKTVSVRGPDPTAMKTMWVITWDGAPEKEKDQFKWKWAVVRTTITNIMPDWTAPTTAEPKKIEEWNKFFSKASSYAEGRMNIYSSSAESFVEALSVLRSKDEAALKLDSARIFQEIKNHAEVKQQGYERRTKKIFDVLEK